MKAKCVWINDEFYDAKVAEMKAHVLSRHRSRAWKNERIKGLEMWAPISREMRILESGSDPARSRRFIELLQKHFPFKPVNSSTLPQ